MRSFQCWVVCHSNSNSSLTLVLPGWSFVQARQEALLLGLSGSPFISIPGLTSQSGGSSREPLEQSRDIEASAVSLQHRHQIADANGRKDIYRLALRSEWGQAELRLGCLLPSRARGFKKVFNSSWWSWQVSGCSCRATAALWWELLTSLIWRRAVAECTLLLEICRENCSIFRLLDVLSTSGLAAI